MVIVAGCHIVSPYQDQAIPAQAQAVAQPGRHRLVDEAGLPDPQVPRQAGDFRPVGLEGLHRCGEDGFADAPAGGPLDLSQQFPQEEPGHVPGGVGPAVHLDQRAQSFPVQEWLEGGDESRPSVAQAALAASAQDEEDEEPMPEPEAPKAATLDLDAMIKNSLQDLSAAIGRTGAQ